MAFDKNTAGEPIVKPEKATTQVNIWVIIGTLVFVLFGVLALVHVHKHPPLDTHDPAAAAAKP